MLPFTSGHLAGPETTNIRLQSKCPFDFAGHGRVPVDGPAIRLVLDALGRPGPASPTFRPPCLP